MKELAKTQLKIDQSTQFFFVQKSYSEFCESLWDLQYIILPDDSHDYAGYWPVHFGWVVTKNVPSDMICLFSTHFYPEYIAKPCLKAVFFLIPVHTLYLF